MSNNVISRHTEIGLRCIGIWPGFTHRIGFFLILGFTATMVFFELRQTVSVYHHFNKLFANLAVTLAVLSAVLKMITFRGQGRNVMFMVQEILNDWTAENQNSDAQVIRRNLELGRKLTKYCTIAYNCLLTTYLIGAILNYRTGVIETRPFVLPSKYPEICKYSPYYEVVCLIQFTTCFFNTNSNAVIEGLLATLVLHAGTKAHIIQRELNDFAKMCKTNNDNNSTTMVSDAMAALIRRHWNFNEYVRKIEEIYTLISFVHVYSFTFLHVIVAYMLLEVIERGDFSIRVLIYAIFTTRALFSTSIYCIAGEYLMNQSEKIFKDLYDCSWYDFPTADKKAINFMLMSARKPMYLTTFKLGLLTHNYLTSIIRTSYSFLSLTRTVR